MQRRVRHGCGVYAYFTMPRMLAARFAFFGKGCPLFHHSRTIIRARSAQLTGLVCGDQCWGVTVRGIPCILLSLTITTKSEAATKTPITVQAHLPPS